MPKATKNNDGYRTLMADGMGNNKLKHTIALERAHIVSFSLPAVITCPGADKCLKGGYCQAGNYNFKSNKDKFAYNLAVSRTKEFVQRINDELSQVWTFTKYVRIHPTGDFYNVTYIKKWVEIALSNPGIVFYAYTKSIKAFKGYLANHELPNNMIITYSYGSKYDELINPDTDYHAVVIGPNDDIPTGYVDGSINDLVMVKGHKKIALKFHHSHMKYEDTGFIEIKNPF